MSTRISIAELFGLPGEQARFDSAEVSAPPSGMIWRVPSAYGSGRVFIAPLLGGANLALMETRFADETEIYADLVAQENLSFTVCLEGSLVNATSGRESVRIAAGETLFARYAEPPDGATQAVSSHFRGGEPGMFLTIHLSPDWLASGDQAFLTELIGNPFWHGVYNCGPASPWMLALAREVLQCSHQPCVPWHLLSAKVLELWSHQLELLRKLMQPPGARLKAQDVARIHQAAAILVDEMHAPPGLLRLAWRVGINDHKLKLGFREVYGSSAFAYLQKQRLQRARRLIGEQGIGVMQAAQAVGFRSPSHFSTIFKQAFGISPSGLSGARAIEPHA